MNIPFWNAVYLATRKLDPGIIYSDDLHIVMISIFAAIILGVIIERATYQKA